MNTVATKDIKRAINMAHAVMDSRSARVGRITGESGTGKTEASHFIAESTNGVRVCASAGMSQKALMMRICRAFNRETKGTADLLMERVADVCKDRLIIIDEANHLRWSHMERLRYLPDEAGAGLILVGTELLERTFREGRNRVYLAQLARRIGGKQVRFGVLSDEAIAGYIIGPKIGQAPSKAIVNAFQKHARGYWGEATELMDACVRVMETQGISTLDKAVVDAAAIWLAQRD